MAVKKKKGAKRVAGKGKKKKLPGKKKARAGKKKKTTRSAK